MTTSSKNADPSPKLAAELRRVARAQRRSTPSVMVEALQTAGKQEAAQDAILRRLAGLEARIERGLYGGVEIKEILLWFVRVWLEHNPPIDEDFEESAVASASERFERFIDYVADALNAGRSAAPQIKLEDVNGATP